MAQDSLNRYLFDNVSVRGELVQLNDTYQQIVTSQEYPAPVKGLLGELLVATSLLTATLKFEGSITVQLQGDGPVSLAVINGTHDQKLRGVARWEGEVPTEGNIHQLMGKGHMVITITPNKGERYQGIVALEGDDLATVLENYFAQSEQLNTKLWFRQDETHAAGMLLQALPGADDNGEAMDHLTQLTSTVKNEELFELPAEEVLYRLYHQENVQLFPAQEIEFKCTCSKEKCEAAIITLPKDQLDEILAEDGAIAMNCDYCGSSYSFDAIDVAALQNNAQKGSQQQH
ncbi:Hsp33 family molecular chaperone HslO [Vibrio sp. SS-MA-C1-2]|uniref:Hsp33 family molecular chaperone HslO n=1 Tax=Vibrio sp. SS-MA-C1-2 TaxID=2908646 RepID=UPI001F358157|nr:Hsp33 family molecular chaperone HslO [Vibrio sp. SS-MA-C1-2]UJF19440.1 Hsp33 family molecular chaperone HslO [Vibrio sp. SS-MA-C1-2]